MARFAEFEEFLRRQETALIDEADNSVARRISSRYEHDPMIRSSFDIFNDWYQTVIRPRTGLLIVPKKREKPEGHNDLLDTSLYRYRVNLITPNITPRGGGDPWYSYRQAGETQGTDWDPDVALQFNIKLEQKYDLTQRKKTDDLEMTISIQAWGSADRESAASVADGFGIDDAGWYRNGTSLWIYPENQTLPQVEQKIESSLKFLTPNVLNHQKFWS